MYLFLLSKSLIYLKCNKIYNNTTLIKCNSFFGVDWMKDFAILDHIVGLVVIKRNVSKIECFFMVTEKPSKNNK